jgi:hypothetical protein
VRSSACTVACTVVWLAAGGFAWAGDDGRGDSVVGTVRSGRLEEGAVHLALSDGVQVRLLVGWLSGFPAQPEKYYVGKSVSVRGQRRWFRGIPEVVVRDPQDIVVLQTGSDEVAAPEVGSEVESLRERVRELEREIQQLEHLQGRGDE